MLHIFLAVYIVSFSIGLVVATLSLLAYARFGLAAFRHVTLFFVSVLLLLLCGIIKTYESATIEHVFGGFLPLVAFSLTVPGNGLFAFMICVIACEVVSLAVTPWRKAAHILLLLAAAACGGAKEVLPQRLFLSLNDAVLAAIMVYGVVLVARRVHDIKHPRLLALVRSVMAVAVVMVSALVIQVIGQATLLAPVFLNSFPVVQILFYLTIACLLLFYAMQYLFQPEMVLSYQLPDEIVRQYGISPREREIIIMLVQGYTNRVIGEKLFISSITVKNHIYHIYQKTGVTNKIQLINLINSPK